MSKVFAPSLTVKLKPLVSVDWYFVGKGGFSAPPALGLAPAAPFIIMAL